MSEINNYVNMPAAQPVVKKRRGRGLAVVAMIMGIFSNAASLFTAWLVFWLAYGRENMALIRTATISLVIPAVAIAALILSIVAKKIGAGKNQCRSFQFVEKPMVFQRVGTCENSRTAYTNFLAGWNSFSFANASVCFQKMHF